MGFRSMCALTLSGILLSCGCETKAQQEFAALEAVKNLRLPNRPGEVDLYYSTCCRERAIEVQNTLEDYLLFYKARLGIHVQFAVAVLDKDDWNRVDAQNPNHAGGLYGMTHWVGPPYVAFVPADDGGVITQNLLADRGHETTETRDLLNSVHMSFDKAASKFILHPAMHELGHRLLREYGIQVESQESTAWFFEVLASYFAYAYEKERRPELATIVEAVAKMSSPPVMYTAPSDLPKSLRLMATGNSSNFIWYQHRFEGRIVDVYARQGLDFLPKVKAAFSGQKGEINSKDLMSSLEQASPGFETWSSHLANTKTDQGPKDRVGGDTNPK
jgi:hypothetical protein